MTEKEDNEERRNIMRKEKNTREEHASNILM